MVLFLFVFFAFCHTQSLAGAGHVLINLPDLNEKQIDSVRTWFSPDSTIVESGFCVDNKLLMIRLLDKNKVSIDQIYVRLKSHGIEKFFLKDEISLDRFHQNCRSFIAFP